MTDRYIRQRTLSSFGDAAQEKLSAASVLVIGAGGLGVPALQYLNAMGVGRLGIVDADTVALSNLHRQPLYTEKDLGQPKAEVIGRFLELQNSGTKKEIHKTYLNKGNSLELLAGYDIILDASDNFGTRYLVNDTCVILGKPFIYGGLFSFEGQVSVFNFQGGPTYRCLYPDIADGVIADCNTNGVLGVVPGIIGNLQALEAVKMITGIGEVLSGKLLLVDTLSSRTHKIAVRPVADNFRITQLSEDDYTVPCSHLREITPEDLEKNMEDYLLVDVRNQDEYDAFHIPGSVHIPLNELKSRIEEIPWKLPLCLICQQAVRTKKAAELLGDRYGDLYELSGGINNYLKRHRNV